MTSMIRSVLVSRVNAPLRVVDLPQPSPGRGEVRIAVEACGICGSDVAMVHGEFGGNDGCCQACREGDAINCVNLQVPGLAYPGGYAESTVVPTSALARIPPGLTFTEAAPMGCAGVTVFNALRRTSAWPGDLVAVVGVGGLGHLAVQFASKMGFDTIAIDRGSDKEATAR